MSKNFRNVGIILLLAALVAFVPGGEAFSRTLILAISLGFLAGIGYLGVRLYREQQLMLSGLSDSRRAVLYGSIGLIALLIAGYETFSGFGGGVLIWLALLLGAAGAIFLIVREANRYG